VQFVRDLNGDLLGHSKELTDFLFGSGRQRLEAYRSLLTDFQGDECFYCCGRLRGQSEVDHFIPWSRYPVDLGHNFVLAHKGCNNSKADRLASMAHLERWCLRNAEYGPRLAHDFTMNGLPQDLPASRRIAAWAYEQAEISLSFVWERGDVLFPISPTWRRLLIV